MKSKWIWDLETRYVIAQLNLSCWVWDLKGMPICKKHGFHAQRWVSGYCRKCHSLIGKNGLPIRRK